MLTIKREDNFDFMSSDYAELFQRSDASAFQSPVWMASFYRHLVPARLAKPVIVTIYNNERLIAVIGLVLRKIKGLKLLEATDLGVSDYASPIVDPKAWCLLQVRKDLVEEIREAIGSHHIVRLRPILPEHVSAWQMFFGGDAEELDFAAHSVSLTQPFDEWRSQNLDKKLAGMVARKGKRWKRQHDVVLERIEDPTNIKLAIANLAKLRSGRFEGDPIQTKPVEAFYAHVASMGAEQGASETWMVRSDGEIAGILFGLTHRGVFLYLLIGADYDGHGRHSPGLQMYDWIIEDWMNRGGTSFDFTIGDEPFKPQFGTSAKPMGMILKGNGAIGHVVARLLGKKLRRENNG